MQLEPSLNRAEPGWKTPEGQGQSLSASPPQQEQQGHLQSAFE